MEDISWFIVLCIVMSILFAAAIVVLTVATLSFRTKVQKKYDRGNFSG